MTALRRAGAGARRIALGAFTVGLGLLLAAGPAAARPDDLSILVDDLMRVGDESPQAAIDSLTELGLTSTGADPLARRLVVLGHGVVAARNGRDTEARAQIDTLLAARTPPDVLARADANLIRAELEENGGHAQASYAAARAALDDYAIGCDPGPRQRADCDLRSQWRALQLAQNGATGQGNLVVAAAYAQSMQAVAHRLGDRAREAVALGIAGMLAQANADSVGANRLMAQAQRLARSEDAPWLDVRLGLLDGMLHHYRDQPEQAQRAFETALAAANAAGLKRPAMQLRANLSDAYVHEGRPRDALSAIQLALPVARQHHDLRMERLLLHNATLAHLALGRVAEAKGELTRVLRLWQRDTGAGQRAMALREFGDALAKAGDLPAALELFHQEEALAVQIRAANKAAAESELRARYDQDTQKRRIELLARDNQLKNAALANQTLTRRLWMLAGAAFGLGALLALLMYLRMRELNRSLVRHEALLRVNSESDALTGLANRRQFREVMRVRGGDHDFRGGLLMVDVDHFKRINDRHGHAAGDRVLAEVARRLRTAVRSGDLVARWGGEEFLVFAPAADGAELDRLAERVRVAMNQSAVPVDGGAALEVTVSIGYAAFPLPSGHVPMGWEQAVNLADLSLYTAKNQGRDCAVGIVGTTAATRAALREVEADLARAQREGRVTLRRQPAVEAPGCLQPA